MPEKQKEPKNCHDCGLEAIDDCQSENKHIPSDENLAPCCWCSRNANSKSVIITDFWAENWTRDFATAKKGEPSYGRALLEDPTPHEVTLLKYLHIMSNGGGERIGF